MLRLIVDRPDECCALLKTGGFVVQETDVLAVEVEDKPGGLARVLALLDANSINIEYMYATIEKKADRAAVIFKTSDRALTEKVLAAGGISLSGDEFIRKI